MNIFKMGFLIVTLMGLFDFNSCPPSVEQAGVTKTQVIDLADKLKNESSNPLEYAEKISKIVKIADKLNDIAPNGSNRDEVVKEINQGVKVLAEGSAAIKGSEAEILSTVQTIADKISVVADSSLSVSQSTKQSVSVGEFPATQPIQNVGNEIINQIQQPDSLPDNSINQPTTVKPVVTQLSSASETETQQKSVDNNLPSKTAELSSEESSYDKAIVENIEEILAKRRNIENFKWSGEYVTNLVDAVKPVIQSIKNETDEKKKAKSEATLAKIEEMMQAEEEVAKKGISTDLEDQALKTIINTVSNTALKTSLKAVESARINAIEKIKTSSIRKIYYTEEMVENQVALDLEIFEEAQSAIKELKKLTEEAIEIIQKKLDQKLNITQTEEVEKLETLMTNLNKILETTEVEEEKLLT